MKLNRSACSPVTGPNLTVVQPVGAETRDGEGHRAPNGTRPEGARKIEQSVAYMASHLSEPLPVSKLARAAHISASHFFVLFKRWTGFSPIDYLIRLRMQEACRMLAATPLSVKEIAGDLGYEDPFYFSRVFKSVHGMAPTDYRSLMEQQEQRPLQDLLGHNPRNERSQHEKDTALRYARGIYLLQ